MSTPRNHNIAVSQVYAIGIDMDNKPYTISWFDTDEPFLSSLGHEMGFQTFFITEVEGKASGEDLHRLRNVDWVGVIDLEESGRKPTGIYDLITQYDEGAERK